MRIDVLRADELTATHRATWRDLVARDPQLWGPFFGLGFVDMIARFRGDVLIAVFEFDGAVCGFLPVQRPRGARVAMPIGAPLCDYQGLIAAADFLPDWPKTLRALGVDRLDFPNALGEQQAFAASIRQSDEAFVVRFAGIEPPFSRWLRAQGSRTVRRLDGSRRKMGREIGEIRVEHHSASRAALDFLFAYKSAQYRRTRQPDLLDRRAWTRAVIENYATQAGEDLFGAMSVLYAGDRIAAVNLGLRTSRVWHGSFITHDPDLEMYSPGLCLFLDVFDEAQRLGLAELDLSTQSFGYKDKFANARRAVGAGFVGRRSLPCLARRAHYAAAALAERLPLGPAKHWPAKAMRRLDLLRAMRSPNRAVF